jgi:hypothetical protein
MNTAIKIDALFSLCLLTALIIMLKPMKEEKIGNYGPPKPEAVIVTDYQDGTALYSDGTIGKSN